MKQERSDPRNCNRWNCSLSKSNSASLEEAPHREGNWHFLNKQSYLSFYFVSVIQYLFNLLVANSTEALSCIRHLWVGCLNVIVMDVDFLREYSSWWLPIGIWPSREKILYIFTSSWRKYREAGNSWFPVGISTVSVKAAVWTVSPTEHVLLSMSAWWHLLKEQGTCLQLFQKMMMGLQYVILVCDEWHAYSGC